MGTKKFKLTSEEKTNWFGRKLYRIRACRDFICANGYIVHKDDLGGWVESERNLAQDGDCWIFGNAEVWGGATVSKNAVVSDNAEVCGCATVDGNAEIYGNAKINGNAWVMGDARVGGRAKLYGEAQVLGDADIVSARHFFCASPIGEHTQTMTIYRDKNRELRISFGFESYDYDDFIGMMLDEEWSEECSDIAKAAFEVAKKHIRMED